MGRKKILERQRLAEKKRFWRRGILIALAVIVFTLILSSNGKHAPQQEHVQSKSPHVVTPALPVVAGPEERFVSGLEWAEEKRRVLDSMIVFLNMVEFDEYDAQIAHRLKETALVKFPPGHKDRSYVLALVDLQARNIRVVREGIRVRAFFTLAVSLMHEGDHLFGAPPGIQGPDQPDPRALGPWYEEEARVHPQDLKRIERMVSWVKASKASSTVKSMWLSELDTLRRSIHYSARYYGMRLAHLRILECVERAHERLTKLDSNQSVALSRLSPALELGNLLLGNTTPREWATASNKLEIYAEQAKSLLDLVEEEDREVVRDYASWILLNAPFFSGKPQAQTLKGF